MAVGLQLELAEEVSVFVSGNKTSQEALITSLLSSIFPGWSEFVWRAGLGGVRLVRGKVVTDIG